jgi:hypothetical protein
MPSGQVSVWVPLAVAAIAMAGLLAGSWLGSRREERRWQRERERDELRWRRERELSLQRRWQDERFAAYAQFIDVMNQWELAITEVAFAQEDDEPVDPALIERMEQLDEQVRPVLARITLIGSPSVQAQCQELVLMYARGYRDARVGDPILAGDPILTGDLGRRSAADVLGDAYYALVDDIRRELGVGPLEEAEGAGGAAPLLAASRDRR